MHRFVPEDPCRDLCVRLGPSQELYYATTYPLSLEESCHCPVELLRMPSHTGLPVLACKCFCCSHRGSEFWGCLLKLPPGLPKLGSGVVSWGKGCAEKCRSASPTPYAQHHRSFVWHPLSCAFLEDVLFNTYCQGGEGFPVLDHSLFFPPMSISLFFSLSPTLLTCINI